MLKDKIETQKFCLLKQIDYLKKIDKWATKRNDIIRFWSHHTIYTLEKDLDITQYAESLFIEILKQQEVRYLQNLVYDGPFIGHPYELEHLARTKIFICEYVNRKCKEKGMLKAIKYHVICFLFIIKWKNYLR